MPPTPIPAYPVLVVNVHQDGSAHANVAGRHIDYPPVPAADTRTAVTQYAAELATTLGRPIRITTTDPHGTWQLAVHPNGTVTDLAPPASRRRRPPLEHTPTPNEGTTLSASVPTAALATVELVAGERLNRGAIATLRFGTGDVARVSSSALIGRRPAAVDGELVDQLVVIDDLTRTVSKTHLLVAWVDGQLWTTDLHSGNGSQIRRPVGQRIDLAPGRSYPVRHGDVVHIGGQRFSIDTATSSGTQDER
ncbi:FHA domain-containing protein [Herbiconiux daphne]|uniref:FHA domain-containing protein n=1 Tax=Herbiconiux daphne TaxID=2970914 RepID=A0ABT2H780_9MICO|nr:FHA domain-containing protein [Herbiconiux daphne]MCS5735782.1 FHA domain-containing protein [Herbiconiux daphne]